MPPSAGGVPVPPSAGGVPVRPTSVGRLRGVILICLAASLALSVGGFAQFVSSLDRSEREPAARADAIVALTGGAQRIGDAIELLAQGYGTRLLITGVNEKTGREEIAKLNEAQRRLVECCVDLDYRARNTIGNAAETRRWVTENGFGSLIVVTSNYHMPRTMAELDHALPDVRKVPYAVVALPPEGGIRSKLSSARLLGNEYVKYVAARLRTFVSPPPGPALDARNRRLSRASPGQEPVR